MITEHRKRYMEKWKRDNRDRVRTRFRSWYERNRDKPYYHIRSVIKPSEEYAGTSGLGRRYELIAKSILKGSELEDSFHSHFDLTWNGLKIDVKIRNKNKKDRYVFTGKKKCVASHYLCFCVDGMIKYILLIPSEIYRNAISLTDKSIETTYRKYLFIVKDQ